MVVHKIIVGNTDNIVSEQTIAPAAFMVLHKGGGLLLRGERVDYASAISRESANEYITHPATSV
jgi:hypothetical protein